MLSFLLDNYKIWSLRKKYNYLSDIIDEIYIDNKIYYGHNLKLLDCYCGEHINYVKLELNNKYKNIDFFFVHKSIKENKYLCANINMIYVIFDDFYQVIEFKGIDHRKNNYHNILRKN